MPISKGSLEDLLYTLSEYESISNLDDCSCGYCKCKFKVDNEVAWCTYCRWIHNEQDLRNCGPDHYLSYISGEKSNG